MTTLSRNALLLLVFAISGFSGLVYESVWTSYLKLLLGHAAYAQTLVLVIFMGGMALGAWLVSRISTTVRTPLLWYAVIEAIIGVFGIFFHQEFLLSKGFLYETALGLRRRCTSFGLGKSRYVWQKRGNLTKSCTVHFTEDVLKRCEHLCYVNEVVLELDVL